MSTQQSTSLATSVPSRRAPIRTRTTAGWRLSVTNSSARSSTALTGLPALRASAATSASSRTNVFAPNEPPIGGRDHADPLLRDAEQPGQVGARVERRLGAAPQRQPRRPPTRRARRAAPSARARRSACGRPPRRRRRPPRSPSATSPWRIRKRWQTFVRAIGRTSIETASPADAADCSCTSGAPRRDRRRAGRRRPAAPRTRPRPACAAARAAARVGAATAATTSPAWRAGVGEHALVLDLAAVEAEVGDVVAA